MKQLCLIIPTRNRLKKLLRTIESIDILNVNFPMRIVVATDCDSDTADKVDGINPFIDVVRISSSKQRSMGSVFCRNYCTSRAVDGVSWGTDDIEYEPEFFNRAFLKYNVAYPDDDGVLAFNVLNNKHKVRVRGQSVCGIGMVGKIWLSRYPNKQLFFPGYFHFSCQEIAVLGLKLGKLHLDESLKLYHLSPAAGEEVDQTHIDARLHRNDDKQLWKQRRIDGLLWGENV